MLGKAERLATADINRLSQGKSVFGTLLSLRYVPAERLKMAVTAPKKVAPLAVDRNRLRRRVYAALRRVKGGVKTPVFAMLTPKKECLSCPIEAIESELKVLFNKANLS